MKKQSLLEYMKDNLDDTKEWLKTIWIFFSLCGYSNSHYCRAHFSFYPCPLLVYTYCTCNLPVGFAFRPCCFALSYADSADSFRVFH